MVKQLKIVPFRGLGKEGLDVVSKQLEGLISAALLNILFQTGAGAVQSRLH
jgi:hypothetical protein